MLNKELFIEEIEILNHKRAKFSESGIISLELRKSAVNFITLFLYNKLNQLGLAVTLYQRRYDSLDEFYTRVSNVTKQRLYQYIKDNNTTLLDYNFRDFFQHCIKKNKIQVMSHHFTNHKIEGLTIIDQDGISFSYERDNPKVKQNFILCHELGHFILTIVVRALLNL